MTRIENTERKVDPKIDQSPRNPILFLAPMAGYTDLPFRLLAKENGADATVSEMVSAKGLFYGDKKTATLTNTVAEESPYGIQIFGSEPEILSKAVNLLQEKRENGETDFDFIDFNIGCPAPKIVKNGDGSALLNDLDLLKTCIDHITQSSDLPVTVKTRIGFKDNDILNIIETLDKTDVDLITVHGRTRDQFYSGESNWEAVQTAVENTDKPVILSGDITSPEKAKKALETGVAGLMIGRAAVDNPLIFNQIKDYLNTGNYQALSTEDRINMALRHLELSKKYSDHPKYIVALRKQLAAYTKGMPNAAEARTEIFKATEAEQIKEIFNRLRYA